MLTCQIKFADYLKKLEVTLQDTEISHDASLLERVLHTELLLPVIGAFSAGKITLLNTLIGQQTLPVGIAPETELATELRYSPEPYIIAIKHNGEEDHFHIDSLGEINKHASKYSHLQAYIDSPALKEIAPLVLVDMPGFGSSLENHNKAIEFYLPRGVHFIVVTSIEDGNLTRSMIRRLDEIKTYDSDFTFILSKCNLRAAQQVEDVAAYINEQLQDYFQADHRVTTLGNQTSAPFARVLQSINAEALFSHLFLETLKNQNMDVLGQISLAASALKRSGEETKQALQGLEQAMRRLREQKAEAEAQVRQRYSGRLLDRCIRGVENDLNAEIDNLSALAVSSNSRLSNAIGDIMRSSLNNNLKRELEDISDSMIADFANGLSVEGKEMATFNQDQDWINDLTQNAKAKFERLGDKLHNLSESLSQLSEKENKGTDSSKNPISPTFYRVATTSLAVTTSIVLPVIELAIIFLPDILRFLSSLGAKEKARERLQSEVFPGIKAELRKSLPPFLDEQLEFMIKKIGGVFEQQIAQQQSIIVTYEKQHAENAAQNAERLQKLETLASEIKNLANNYLYTA